MLKQLHKAGVEIIKGVSTILGEVILSLVLLGAAAVLLQGGYQLLAMAITPVGMLVGFVFFVPTTYVFVQLVRDDIN